MSILVYIAMFGWIPMILLVFMLQVPHRAIITAFTIGWLYLPSVVFPLSGLPDYDKVAATVVGTLLGAFLFDMGSILAFRPRWFDIPFVAWTLAPIFSVLSAGVDLYEGISAGEHLFVVWALPYFIGRIYLNSLTNLRDMALGIIIGGLSYVPLCLIEVRFSPILNRIVYGFDVTAWEGTRFGGFRPRVFTNNGLECGMWMAVVMMIAYRCWARGSIRTMAGWPFGMMVAILTLAVVLCKSSGAAILMGFGLALLWFVRVTKSTWLVWVVVLLPFAYVGVRSSNIWSGQQLLNIAATYLGQDRADSLKVRLDCEDLLAAKASQKWAFGWGVGGRSRIYDEQGIDRVVTDGLWIITFGEMGMFAVVVLYTCINLPLALFIKRYPVTVWSTPEVAPAAALAVILGLYAIDTLSNAMPSPLYALIAGGVSGLPLYSAAKRRSPLEERLDLGDELVATGRPEQAMLAYHEAIAAAPKLVSDAISYRELAEVHHRLAELTEAEGRREDAEIERRAAVEIYESLAGDPHALIEDKRGLAISLDALARNIDEQGRAAESLEYRRRSVAEYAGLVSLSRDDHDLWVLGLNDLAWSLSTSEDSEVRDPDQAVLLAERATIESPTTGAYWNTLGVARYRAGDDRAALAALDRSIQLDPLGGTAFDLLFRAMALFRMGDESAGLDSLARGIAWADRHRPNHPGLARFRREAQGYLSEIVDDGPQVSRS